MVNDYEMKQNARLNTPVFFMHPIVDNFYYWTKGTKNVVHILQTIMHVHVYCILYYASDNMDNLGITRNTDQFCAMWIKTYNNQFYFNPRNKQNSKFDYSKVRNWFIILC